MSDLTIIQLGIMALVSTGWVAILAVAGLKGWNGWLALKRTELELSRQADCVPVDTIGGITSRIELADLKERIRKLEAIAAGIDL